ncbi:ATP synthase F1 subunit gamma [Humisphaera borealis]|uniref:ATP synthase gamma chain n=1 Tax=Humisphaera borealis TaxID=2807512 RepID=A0A7M2WYE3_9BACT|nr:ATP synthase F1 subunit gamma [Humisphaera borealis]QOV90518.1 ATP synthase F1 subunit gamma [Humisphaera borealis]
MAKARAILKRRKSLRNIRKITKTMQMIATAKFQKSLKRAVGTKPYTQKVRELVRELAASVGNVEHPLLRRPDATTQTNRIGVLVLTSNRGLAGAYNGNVLRTANIFLREQQAAGKTIDLYVAGKKGVTSFNFQKRAITQKIEALDTPAYASVEELANDLMHRFEKGELDSVSVVYMNFISTGVQKPDVMTLLPLAGVQEAADHIGQQVAEKEQQAKSGALDSKRSGEGVTHEEIAHSTTTYDFSPDAKTLLDEVLPLTVRTALFQTFLDATTSEHVARMVAMKSATDNAEKMGKILAMQYNRARQSQITTELMEIMGGVEAMK